MCFRGYLEDVVQAKGQGCFPISLVVFNHLRVHDADEFLVLYGLTKFIVVLRGQEHIGSYAVIKVALPKGFFSLFISVVVE